MADKVLRHPRRIGFIIFNLLVLAAVAAWLLLRPQPGELSVADVPNVTIATAGIVVLLVVWAAAWIAWAIMVVRRRMLIRAFKASGGAR